MPMPLAIFWKGSVAENAAAINDQSINQQSFESITTKSNFISHQYRPYGRQSEQGGTILAQPDTGHGAMPSRSGISMIQTNSQKSR
jgi:hypothetical protein